MDINRTHQSVISFDMTDLANTKAQLGSSASETVLALSPSVAWESSFAMTLGVAGPVANGSQQLSDFFGTLLLGIAMAVTLLSIFSALVNRMHSSSAVGAYAMAVVLLCALQLFAPLSAWNSFALGLLSIAAIELTLSLKLNDATRVLSMALRATQVVLLLCALIGMAQQNYYHVFFTLSHWTVLAVFFTLMLVTGIQSKLKASLAAYVFVAWGIMSFALAWQQLVNPNPFGAPVAWTATASLCLLGMFLIHDGSRVNTLWRKRARKSIQTDRMLVLERSRRLFLEEVESFVDSVDENDFEEAICSSFLTHLEKVISVAASAVVVSHRGKMRVVTRFPYGSEHNFASILSMREELLQSICLQDRAAVVHANDLDLRVGNSPVSTLCVVPVKSTREDWAGIVLARTLQENFRVDELFEVKEFAEHVHDAMVQVERFKKIRRQAETDQLTGLLNREAITQRAERVFKKSRSLNSDLSMLFIDVDNFKQVNDTYGHEVGDQALTQIANVCQSCLRDKDKVGRYGGEEFIAVLPDTGTDNASRVAERIREAVARQPLVTNGRTIELTVSVGISELRPRFDDYKAMLRAADRALYRAKDEGRNRVVHHETMVLEVKAVGHGG